MAEIEDDVEKLKRRRSVPDELRALGEQVMLNLLCASEKTEIFVTIDGRPVDYGAIIVQRASEINERFDKLMIQLGYPAGTGKFWEEA